MPVLPFALASSLALCLPPAPAVPQSGIGGNVCVIVLDDVAPGMIGVYDDAALLAGRPSQGRASTPQIDARLAFEGIRFDRAWSMPSCSPSRAAMLTGRIGSRSGIGQIVPPRATRPMPGLDPDIELLPALLRLAPSPYSSGAVGKWHLADRDMQLVHPQHPLGMPVGSWFDRFAGTWNNLPSGTTYDSAGYYVWAKEYASRISLASNPCLGSQPPCTVDMDVNVSPFDYPSVDTVDDAITLVNELPEPWFLWVTPHATHVPAHPLPAGLPANPCSGAPAPGPGCTYQGLTTEQSEFRCMLEALDHQLGRLFCQLDFNDTTVILVGDNGWGQRSRVAPYLATRAKGSVYQGGVEVPLIIRSPVIPTHLRGTSSGALVSVVDVFATVRELAGAPPAVFAEDSVSLLPVLKGTSTTTRPTLYTEKFTPNFVPDFEAAGPPAGYICQRHEQTVRDDQFKLIRRTRRLAGGGPPVVAEEFYDLLAGGPPNTSTIPPTPQPDWHEQNDLLAPGATLTPLAASTLAALRLELDLNYPPLVQ